MAASNFAASLAETLSYEGGYVDNPKDPGGATNLGVTIGTLGRWFGRPATKAEVKALTVEKVSPIYRRWYWDKVRGDELAAGVDFSAFDYGVNSGPARAVKALQKAVGVKADGVFGPKTMAAVAAAIPTALIPLIWDGRLSWLQTLKTWGAFGKGWARRIGSGKAKALLMAGAAISELTAEAANDNRKAVNDNKRAGQTGTAGAATAGGGAVAADQVSGIDWTAIAGIGVAAAILIACAIVLARRAQLRREVAAGVAAVAEAV